MTGNRPYVLRVPQNIDEKLVETANQRGVSVQTIILERLAKSFRMKVEPPKEGWKPGRKRKPE